MNMLEKAARALATADERNGGPPYEYRVQNKYAKEMLFDEARAVIAALRLADDGQDCPEHVRLAGEEAYSENGDARAIFTAMLDALLEGNENDDA